MKKLRPLPLAAGLAAIALVGWLLAGHWQGNGGSQAKARGGGPVAVVTSPAESGAVPIELAAVGTIQPIATVAIRPRIDSAIEAVHFQEGQDVQQGDLLFTLDARPARAALQAAEANLAKDQAQLVRAGADLKRYEALFHQGNVTQQQFESARATEAGLQASIKGDQAAVETARLTLGYTEIRSPISGRTGALQVKPGNLVKGNDTATVLTTVTQISPISVAFNVPEGNLAQIRHALGNAAPQVRAHIPDETQDEVGSLTFVDNLVDQQSGTILLKGTFENANRALWPGQFVDVTLHLGEQADAVTVPSQAVQRGQSGPYLFVIGANQAAEKRDIVLGRTAGDRTIVQTGLKAGEHVVVQGALRLTAGTAVREQPSDHQQAATLPQDTP